jgi:hypothetical protein
MLAVFGILAVVSGNWLAFYPAENVVCDATAPGGISIDPNAGSTTVYVGVTATAASIEFTDGPLAEIAVEERNRPAPCVDIDDVNCLSDESIRRIANSGRIRIEDIVDKHRRLSRSLYDENTITTCVLNTPDGLIELQEIPDPNFWTMTQWRLTRIDDGVIRHLAKAGRICEALGHQYAWSSGKFVGDNAGCVRELRCALCGAPHTLSVPCSKL